MATKVFISWSGDLSKRLGEALRKWLPGVLQYVKPYFTPDDIEKGAKWNSDIARELEEANIGLICLTRDNIDKAWILFEAGALSKSFEKSRVCTILFNLDTTDLKGPLTSFQTTRFNKDDIKRLVDTINNAAGDDKLEHQILENVFAMWWPKLEEQVAEILASHTEDNPEARRSDRDILEEMLALTRMSTSRSHRSPRISEEVVMDLIRGIQELSFMVVRGDSETALHLMRRFNPPLKYLSIEAGVPEAYEHFRMKQRHLRRPPAEDLEEAEQEN